LNGNPGSLPSAILEPHTVGGANSGGCINWVTSLSAIFIRPYKFNADLVAVQTHHSTPPIRKAGRRQQQEELLQVQSFESSFHAQARPRLRYVRHQAVSSPRSINSHHEHVDAVLEFDALTLSISKSHRGNPISKNLKLFKSLSGLSCLTHQMRDDHRCLDFRLGKFQAAYNLI
jgi:hypothetical protein